MSDLVEWKLYLTSAISQSSSDILIRSSLAAKIVSDLFQSIKQSAICLVSNVSPGMVFIQASIRRFPFKASCDFGEKSWTECSLESDRDPDQITATSEETIFTTN